MTLRARLTMTVVLLAAMATSVVAIVGYRVTSQRLDSESRASMTAYVSRLRDPDARLATAICGLPALEAGRHGDVIARPVLPRDDDPNAQGLLLQCLDKAGRIFKPASSRLPVDAADISMARRGSPQLRTRLSGDSDDRMRIQSLVVPSVGVVQIGRSLAANDRVLKSVLTRFLVLALFVVAAAALVGWLLARRITGPITTLTAAAESVTKAGLLQFDSAAFAQTPLGSKVPRDETRRLTAAFSAMLEELRSSHEQQARLVQDAGHELRTPLTSLRTNVATLRRHPELADDRRATILDDVQSELRELTALTNELVDLAGHRTSPEPTVLNNVGQVSESAVARCRQRTARTVNLTVEGDAAIVAPEGRLLRAVDNLLGNAAKFSPAGSPIEVSVTTTPTLVSIAVRDHGVGIAATDLSRIFDRFYRADAARSLPGSGLGLAIVHEIVCAVGGTVTAINHADGGAQLTITLPRAEPMHNGSKVAG